MRVHHGADDASYHSIYQKSDDEGLVGVALSKSLLKVVGAALKSNMTTLGPQVRACVRAYVCIRVLRSLTAISCVTPGVAVVGAIAVFCVVVQA